MHGGLLFVVNFLKLNRMYTLLPKVDKELHFYGRIRHLLDTYCLLAN